MKKTRVAVVSLALLGAAGAANAQSSVTLYGVLDAGLTYVSRVDNGDGTGGHLFGMQNGNLSGNRWGMKGQEDLGGGLKAIFQLENGFDPGTGRLNQGGREFGRQAFVGVTSNQFGTVTLGRQYDPSVDLVQGLTADNYWGAAFATPGDLDNYDNSLRVSNAVKYVSPVFGGFQFEGIYGFSNLAGATGQGKTWGGAVAYNNGPLGLAASYLYTDNPSAGRNATTWNSPSSDSLTYTVINNGYASAHSIGIARGAGQYVFGPFTVGASYSFAQYKPDAFSSFGSQEKFHVANGFVNFQLTPAALLGLGYTYTHGQGDTNATYHQVSIGADYAISKRTDVYAQGAYQHASGQQRQTDGTSAAAQASVADFGYAAGRNHQEIAIIGVRHKF
ncbi:MULTISPECIES: porin [unclassified Caballeronia]|uniref:porin n=1 Tax=unclassified Caballeronia TaxID=2646786 RepID=UPI002863BBA7|nr:MULTISPECIES: porin [unclassified Caballeronia]MDR5740020.1 porin [Caballeronia sp. LZ016]MDR5809159.1 porin [Caballeronia sp. LZ019]